MTSINTYPQNIKQSANDDGNKSEPASPLTLTALKEKIGDAMNIKKSANDDENKSEPTSPLTLTALKEKIGDAMNQSGVKEKITDAVHVAAQKLNLEPRERNPEAMHQDGKTGPE